MNWADSAPITGSEMSNDSVRGSKGYITPEVNAMGYGPPPREGSNSCITPEVNAKGCGPPPGEGSNGCITPELNAKRQLYAFK